MQQCAGAGDGNLPHQSDVTNRNQARPARLFADNAHKLESEISQQSKDRFTALFGWLNALGEDAEQSQSAA